MLSQKTIKQHYQGSLPELTTIEEITEEQSATIGGGMMVREENGSGTVKDILGKKLTEWDT